MNEKGQTLIEVLIGVVLIALVFTGLFQGLSVGIWSTFLDDQLTTAQQIARSEIDYIKSQAYIEHQDGQAVDEIGYILVSLKGEEVTPTFNGGVYTALAPNVTSGFDVQFSIDEVTVGNTTVPTDVLQQITMTVSSAGGRPQTFVAYKANVDYGEFVVRECTASHGDEFTIPKLNGGQGYYYTVTTDAEGEISAFWRVEEKLYIEIYIYAGTPSALGDLIARSPEKSQMAATTPSYTVLPGDYTVYFFNPNTKPVNTYTATITYMASSCP